MTLQMNFSIVAILAASTLMAGCAGAADRYPSLAQRDAERVSGTFNVASNANSNETNEQTAPDPALASRLTALGQQAVSAHSSFLSDLEPAVTVIRAANGTNDDDREWSAAQIALANLDSYRSVTAIALGDLDLLYADASVEFDRRREIGEVQSQVAELLAQEDRELARLRQLMPK
ncbi:MAG: hypothetical protein ABJ057_04255 [Erythrobacter sp.]